jgi:outer membrane protein assembly factor BamB
MEGVSRIQALDRNTGNQVWSYLPNPVGLLFTPVATTGPSGNPRLLFYAGDGVTTTLHCIEDVGASATPIWQTPVPMGINILASPTLFGNRLYGIELGSDFVVQVAAYDTLTGARLWSQPLNIGTGVVAPVAVDRSTGVIYVATDNSLYKFGMDGTPQWQLAVRCLSGISVDSATHNLFCTIALPSGCGDFVSFDAAGNRRWSIANRYGICTAQVSPVRGPTPVIGDNRVYVCSGPSPSTHLLISFMLEVDPATGILTRGLAFPYLTPQGLAERPKDMVLTSNGILFFQTFNGTLISMDLASGALQHIVAEPNPGGTPALCVDQNALYWQSDGTLRKLN